MKTKLFMILFAAAAILGAKAAFAESLKPFHYKASVTEARLDPKLGFGKVNGGEVYVDYFNKTASMVLYRDSDCPKGKICIAMLPQPIVVRLPIVAAVRGSCGETVITAQEDLRPVDGQLKKLVITDNQKNFCETFLPLATTQVVYETELTSMINGRTFSTHSVIEAGKLSPYTQPRILPIHLEPVIE